MKNLSIIIVHLFLIAAILTSQTYAQENEISSGKYKITQDGKYKGQTSWRVYKEKDKKIFKIESDYTSIYGSSTGRKILTTTLDNKPLELVYISKEEKSGGTKSAKFLPEEVILSDTSISGDIKDKNVNISKNYTIFGVGMITNSFPYLKYNKTKGGTQNIQAVNLFNGYVMTYKITYIGNEIIELPDGKRVKADHYSDISFYNEYQKESKDKSDVWLDSHGRIVLSNFVTDKKKDVWSAYFENYDLTKTSGTYLHLMNGKYYATEKWLFSKAENKNLIKSEFRTSPLSGNFYLKSEVIDDNDYNPISYNAKWNYPGGEETQTTTFLKDKIKVQVKDTYGQNSIRNFDIPNKTAFSFESLLLYKYYFDYFDFSKKGKQNTKFLETDGKIDSTSYLEYIADENIQVAGKSVKARKVKLTFKDWENHMIMWVDKNLLLLKAEIHLLQGEGTRFMELVELKGHPYKR